MFAGVSRRLSFMTFLKHIISLRLLLIVVCTSLMISVVWIQTVERDNVVIETETVINEALENAARDHRYAEVYRKVEKLQKDIKYILLWTPADYAPFYYFGKGQKAFIDKNCSNINCYVTSDRNFFDGNITKFHAIAFNGRNIDSMTESQIPSGLNRSSQQKYIYFNMESADNYPICNNIFDNFFNWTSTYRLDSDIPFPYIQIKNSKGEVVGPKREMKWEVNNTIDDETLETKIQNKSKAVAWFVSHCKSRSGRSEYANELQKALQKLGLTLDIYGACGPLKCPRQKKNSCDTALENDYYFYLSFENSFAEDYVTEKLLTPLQHYSVPIVFGGANYSRFLPHGSYINAREISPTDLASAIANFMTSSNMYSRLFRWMSSYSYHDPSTGDNVCAVCEALHNKEMFESHSVYENFRSWWNPNYKDRCKR